MNSDFMSSFYTQIGAYVWGIRLVTGTILDIEFGNPKLFVRENKIKSKLTGIAPPRKYSIHGGLQLTIENSEWELSHLDKSYLSKYIGSIEEYKSLKYFEDIAICICGQILNDVTMDKKVICFKFDSGGKIIMHYEDKVPSQFMISIGAESIEYPVKSL